MPEITRNSIQFTQTKSTQYKHVPESLLESELTEVTQSPLQCGRLAGVENINYGGSPFESNLVATAVKRIANIVPEKLLPDLALTGRVVAEADKAAPDCNNLFFLKIASFFGAVSAVLVSGGEIKDSSELTANIIDAAKFGDKLAQWSQTLLPFLIGDIVTGIKMLVLNDLIREMNFSFLNSDSEFSLSTLNLFVNYAIFGFTGMNFVQSGFLNSEYARSTLSMAVSYAFLGFTAGVVVPLGCAIVASVMISAWDAYNAQHKGWLTQQTEKADALMHRLIDGVKETTESVANCVGLK